MFRNCRTATGAGLLLFVIGCGGGSSTPEAAFKDFQAAVKARDADKAWNLLSKESQGQMDTAAKMMSAQLGALDKLAPDARKQMEEAMAKGLGMSADELKTLDGKKMFNLVLKKSEQGGKGGDGIDEFASASLENVKVEGDKASGTFKTSKKSDTVHFVKEGGSWKITMPKK
jgi:hypothetical protein